MRTLSAGLASIPSAWPTQELLNVSAVLDPLEGAGLNEVFLRPKGYLLVSAQLLQIVDRNVALIVHAAQIDRKRAAVAPACDSNIGVMSDLFGSAYPQVQQ
jgi:hypothetical protein